MTTHHDSPRELALTAAQVTLRGPADLADALPYLLGYHPDDSIVLIGLHGPRGRVGGRIRTGIPKDSAHWAEAADQLAACLVESGSIRGARPAAAVVYLCQDPPAGQPAQEMMERLRPLAQRLRTACGTHEVPVVEAIYVSAQRFWSYCCPGLACCSAEGNQLPAKGTSPMAAAAAFAGIRVQGSLKELESRLALLAEPIATRQVRAFDAASAALFPRMLGASADTAQVRKETLELAERLKSRFRRAAAPKDPAEAVADARDDALVTSDEAARLILGLQDHLTRDIAAEWMEGAEAPPALRLWRALARRCVGPYQAHAASLLTLAGWTAWSVGDEPSARVALGRALEVDPECVFARLLHQACNEGIDPEPLRRCMRQQRAARGL